MAIMRWSPAFPAPRDLVSIQDEVNRLFDGFFGRWPQRSDLAPSFTPAVDIEETPEEFVVRADLPGVKQKDVKVSLMGDTLTVRGERKLETEHKDTNLHRIERTFGSFERSFVLGGPVRSNGVKAVFRDGQLEVHVPKAEEAKVREIEVQVG